MRKVAGRLRLELAQYREMAAFAQFGTADLDKATRAQLERGKRITEVLKQPQYLPLPPEQEVVILYAVTNGYLDDVPEDKIMAFERDFSKFMDLSHPEIGENIAATGDLTAEAEEALKAAIVEFKQSGSYYA
jgi:F-type H+-transporting ATPase subunit alpha